jgi:hypothetical protein
MQPTRVAVVLVSMFCISACTVSREAALQRENATLRAQLQEAREQAHANTIACSDLARDRELALSSARQLRADTQYLRTSTTRMSDAITRLSYEDWNKVVPEVQLAFTDVEAASQDLDARIGRVLIALRADAEK